MAESVAVWQVVLCVGSMFWTQEVAEAIRSGTLPAYSNKCTDDLLDVSALSQAILILGTLACHLVHSVH